MKIGNHIRIAVVILLISNFSNITPACAVDPVGVRLDLEGHGEFYHTGTELKFVPRGMSFVRVDFSLPFDVHSTFNIGSYDSQRADNALRVMHSLGYNVVRVFVSIEQLGLGRSHPGLNQDYMNNVIDFLRNARARKIYVILTNGGGIPLNYSSIIDANPAPDNVEDENWIFFHPGFLKAYRRVTRDILESIRDADPDLLNVVFSFDLFNELYFVWDRKPWTLESGDFQFAGKSYDMASPVDRQRLADQAAKLWANGLVRTVRSVSQDTMVTASVFTPNAVGRPGHDGVAAGLDPAERRVPVRARALSGSNLNYIDVHVYPRGPDYKIGEDLKSAEVPTLRKGKPLVMGEYGALKDAYPSIESATQAMDSFLGQSCRYDFDGWLYWTWDTKEQPELWYARETVGGQNMNMVIAPKYLPQICL